MSDVKQALFDFLKSTDTTGDATRDTARTSIQGVIGTAIYNAQRPQRAGPLAMTLSRAGGPVQSPLDTQPSVSMALIDFDIWASERGDSYAASLLEDLYRDLNTLLWGYRGTVGDLTVQHIKFENEPFERPLQPVDASDNWTHHYTLPSMVMFDL